MNFEKMTGEIDLEELEVQAEDITEASGVAYSLMQMLYCKDFYFLCW